MELENENIDRAIALSLVDSQNGNNVIGEQYCSLMLSAELIGSLTTLAVLFLYLV